MPKALKRLQRLIRKGLERTASLWPLVRAAYDWVKRVAKILANATELDGNTIKRHLRALLGAMAKHHNRSAPPLGG